MSRRAEEGLVFRPSLEELQTTSFEDYVTSIEPQLLRVGICRIVAPVGWTPRAAGYAGVDFAVPHPVRQQASGARGLYRTYLVEERPLRVGGRFGFAELASAPEAQAPGGPDADVDVRGACFAAAALTLRAGAGALVLEARHVQPAALRG